MCLATGSRGRLPLGQPGIELYDRLNAHALATIYTTPSPRRVQFGDLLIRHALLCHLLLASAQHPPDHPIILQHVDAMQELLVEVASQTGNMINLIYPLLLAGALARGEDRARTTVLLDFARYVQKQLRPHVDLAAGIRLMGQNSNWYRRLCLLDSGKSTLMLLNPWVLF